MKEFCFVILLVMMGCSLEREVAVRRPVEAKVPNGPGAEPLKPPEPLDPLVTPKASELSREISIYATYYFSPIVENRTGGFPLLAMDGSQLGVSLSRSDWCNAAMEGSVLVRQKDGSIETYNYVGMGASSQVDCSQYYTHAPSHRARFQKVNAPFGFGVQDYCLVPFRTIATDPDFIPTGSVVFIGAAKDVLVTLPNGDKWKHDGYFLAADQGGLIRSNHIDVFIGTTNRNPFSFVTSVSSDRTVASIVTNKEIVKKLKSIHKLKL